MKYTAILDGKEREVEILQQDEYRYRVIIDGRAHELDARFCAPDLVSVLMNNKSHDISFSFDDERVLLSFRHRHFDIEILDERHMRMRGLGSDLQASGPEFIKTSIPGKVIKILVEEGQKVEKDRDIIIVEAMKMENVIRCRNGGVIGKVNVYEGEVVKANVVLVEIATGNEQ